MFVELWCLVVLTVVNDRGPCELTVARPSCNCASQFHRPTSLIDRRSLIVSSPYVLTLDFATVVSDVFDVIVLSVHLSAVCVDLP